MKHKLLLLRNTFAICRLAADASVPVWATGDFISITRTGDELSIVCCQDLVPNDVIAERYWRCLRVAGTLDFSEVGVLKALVGPLAEAGISIFAMSTFETDYLMVHDADLERAVAALGEAGHDILDRKIGARAETVSASTSERRERPGPLST